MQKILNAAIAATTLFIGSMAQASVLELTLTGTWVASDFDVSSTGVATDPVEADDGLVFGIAPSAGSVSVTLLVDTSSVVSYLVGDGPEFPVNNHFGYSNVTLKDPVTLGSATWNTADIVTGLIGPGGNTAALWTDTDLTTGNPTLASFRMIGSWAGTGGTGSADIFFGSRFANADGTGAGITDSFLAWEYFGGEEIRNTGYTATVTNPVPLPASSLLLLAGVGGLMAMRRKSAA